MHVNFLLSIQRLLFSYQDYWGCGGSLLKNFEPYNIFKVVLKQKIQQHLLFNH